MAARPSRHIARLAVFYLGIKGFLCRQGRQHVGCRIEIIAIGLQITHAIIVRFVFLFARIAQCINLRQLPGGLHDFIGLGGNAERNSAQGRERRGLRALQRMLADNVANFMAEDGGELVLGIHNRHQAARDIDITSGHRKGVDDVGIDDGEGALVLQACCGRNLCADRRHISSDRACDRTTKLREDLRMLFDGLGALIRLDDLSGCW